jgi:hypothetical protein
MLHAHGVPREKAIKCCSVCTNQDLENHLLRATKRNSMLLLRAHTRSYQGFSEFFAPCTWKTYATTTTSTMSYRLYINFTVHYDYSPPGCMGSTSTSPCAASTRLPVAAALHRLRCTPPRRRLLGVRLLRLLISTSKLVEGGYYVINN